MSLQIGSDFIKLFTGIKPEDYQQIDLQESFFKQLLDYSIERGYLNEVANDIGSWSNQLVSDYHKPMSWLQINRLPVNPSNSEDYDLLSRWQGALSALHSWGQKVVFLLVRHNGTTNIFLGTESVLQAVNTRQAAEQMWQALSSTMPGIDLEMVKEDAFIDKIGIKLLNMNAVGAVTGIPSFRKQARSNSMQTLDPLAFGLHSVGGDKNFAMLVISEPIRDDDITNIISQYRSIGNSIHNFVKQTVNNLENEGNNTAITVGMGAIISQLLRFAGIFKFAGEAVASGGISIAPELLQQNFHRNKGHMAGIGNGIFVSRGYSHSMSQGINTEYLNKFAQYAEELIDKHVDRLKRGRNYGFWNVGTYVLGSTQADVNSVMGLLRTIYSGEDSYIEPIRLHHLYSNTTESSLADLVKSFQMIPLPYDLPYRYQDIWHPLGTHYQYLSTPLNTEELSLTTSLPRKDVPGLRFVKTVVRFANNPAKVDSKDVISLGHIIDTGVVQKNTYDMDYNTLVKHTMIAGTTGMGKSTTCRKIIDGVLLHNIPVLVVEPAKDEYVSWAIQYNQKIDADSKLTLAEKEKRKFKIFMPGLKEIDGCKLEPLKINPFEPASVTGGWIDMLSHCEQLVAILNASLPTSDVLPIIIDEAVYIYLNSYYYDGFQSGEMKQKEKYVKLEGLIKIAEVVLKQRGYDKKVQDDLLAALKTRFEYLLRGKRGAILNVDKSTNFDDIYDHNVVINLSRITASKDKALLMSLLTLLLYEYRISQYQYDLTYRERAQLNKLLHLTVIEEAHNLLAKPSIDYGRTGDSQKIASEMFSNILSEIRSYGEGIMIVEQVPTKLIPDAIKNTNYKIVHRLVAPDDASLMASTLSLRNDQKDLISLLGQGETIVFGDQDDAATWVKIKKG